jgi:hypothetical protein
MDLHTDTSKQTCSPNQLLKLIAFDHFYKSPYDVRKYALEQTYEYIDTQNHFRSTTAPNIVDMQSILRKKMEPIIGPIRFDEPTGHFHYIKKSSPLVAHTTLDRKKWTAVVFLTPDANIDSGIGLFKSSDDVITLDDHIGNIFNRIIIFNTYYSHRFTAAFGDDLYTGCLYQSVRFTGDAHC